MTVRQQLFWCLPDGKGSMLERANSLELISTLGFLGSGFRDVAMEVGNPTVLSTIAFLTSLSSEQNSTMPKMDPAFRRPATRLSNDVPPGSRKDTIR